MCSGVIFFSTAVRGAACESAPSWQPAQLVKYCATPVLSDRPCASTLEGARLQVSTARAITHEREPIFTSFLLPGATTHTGPSVHVTWPTAESPPTSMRHVSSV